LLLLSKKAAIIGHRRGQIESKCSLFVFSDSDVAVVVVARNDDDDDDDADDDEAAA
jgi:hypothetical protein